MANLLRSLVGAARGAGLAALLGAVGGLSGSGERWAAAEEPHASLPTKNSATPPAGAPLPAAPLLDAPLLDLEDHPVSLRAMRGKVVVVLHQDRFSSEQNSTFKDRLGELVLRRPDKLRLIALAEVGSYNFWPARRYVKDALQPLRALGGAVVACDWKATVQKQYRIPARQSAVFVVSKDGALQVMTTGVLAPARATALLSQIEKLAVD